MAGGARQYLSDFEQQQPPPPPPPPPRPGLPLEAPAAAPATAAPGALTV